MQVFTAGHPVPDARGVRAAGQIMDLLGRAGERDLVLFLISGGGSALLTSPTPGLTLEDLQRLTSLLLRCGASINEINTLRKHLEQAKAGNLARLAYPARTATLVLSDVIGNPLDVIASGPTSPDPTTYQDAWDVLARYDLLAEAPPAVLRRLERGVRGALPETPKPGDPFFASAQYQVVGDNYQAAQAALQAAQQAGLNPLLLTTSLQGEASQAGRFLAAIARQIAPHRAAGSPPCLHHRRRRDDRHATGRWSRRQEPGARPGSRARSGWAGEHFAGHPGDGRRRWSHRRRRGCRQRRDAAASPGSRVGCAALPPAQ